MVTLEFGRIPYPVYEYAGSVSVTVFVQAGTGTLDRNVAVTLSTVNGTAMCESLKPLHLNG